MKFLLPIGGEIPDYFAGVLTTPGHRGVLSAITDGCTWAADNQAFMQGFNPDVFFPWLEKMQPYRDTCLFVACPDVMGDCVETHKLWEHWQPQFGDWPLAYVGQDGETNIPSSASALFVGGTTEWKMSEAAASLIRLATRRELHVHIGRVNWGKRYRHFRQMQGSEHFTCDGTRTRFDGREKTLQAWSSYQAQGALLEW